MIVFPWQAYINRSVWCFVNCTSYFLLSRLQSSATCAVTTEAGQKRSKEGTVATQYN